MAHDPRPKQPFCSSAVPLSPSSVAAPDRKAVRPGESRLTGAAEFLARVGRQVRLGVWVAGAARELGDEDRLASE
jgi:hypothetical protein